MTDRTTVENLLEGLRRDLVDRSINSGFGRLDAHRSLIESTGIESACAAQLVWRTAQWVDVGWADASVIAAILRRFPRAARGGLSLRDYAAIRMAEGVVAMKAEQSEEAVAHFDAVLMFGCDIGDTEILSVANFWKARCLRMKGEYDKALDCTSIAYGLALERGYECMAAVMRVLESWLLFQKSKFKDSLRILGETEAVLRATDDAVVLGNIQSTYGRIYRQEGRYEQAVQHFTMAIDEYRKLGRPHPNLARTLANLGYSKRLVALQLHRKMDADLARRRRAGGHAAGDSQADREHFARLRDEAFAHLDEAAVVYAVHPHHHGAGAVHLNRGLLHYDNGALDLAEMEADSAFVLGEEKQDLILMARARILASMIENAKVEEGIDEDLRRHAQAALDYSRDAIEYARGTQNRRLLGRAYTWHGLTLSNEVLNSTDAAIEAMNTAASYLEHGYHDTAWEDVRLLKSRLAKTHTVDATLQAWSQGAVGDRTFRQISDEFAAILIPKVWELEERKIARVATKLAISPKKVRRILVRAGLLQDADLAPGE